MANATLTRVLDAGAAADWARPAADGGEKWAGSEGVYFHERTDRVVTGYDSSVVVTRSVVVSADLAVDWAQGDTLVFEPTGAGETTGVVRAVARTAFPGAPGIVRLTLEDG